MSIQLSMSPSALICRQVQFDYAPLIGTVQEACLSPEPYLRSIALIVAGRIICCFSIESPSVTQVP